jgi:hypothetical protein
MKNSTPDNPVPREFNALLNGERMVLRETNRDVTPFGGTSVFVTYLRKIGLVGKLRQWMPVQWRSPNHIDPSVTFVSFLMAVLLGAKRFAHANGSSNL